MFGLTTLTQVEMAKPRMHFLAFCCYRRDSKHQDWYVLATTFSCCSCQECFVSLWGSRTLVEKKILSQVHMSCRLFPPLNFLELFLLRRREGHEENMSLKTYFYYLLLPLMKHMYLLNICQCWFIEHLLLTSNLLSSCFGF